MTLLPVLKEKVLERSIVYTDELLTYDQLGRMGYDHRRIHHASKVYVRGVSLGIANLAYTPWGISAIP